MTLGAFFKIFGSKHRTAASYPPPEHADVIEPFAGAAGYATRHAGRRAEQALGGASPRFPEASASWPWLSLSPPLGLLTNGGRQVMVFSNRPGQLVWKARTDDPTTGCLF